MAKLIILSIVIASFLVPIPLSMTTNPRRGLRRTQTIFLVYVVIWAYMCTRWYPTLVELK